MSNIVSSVFFHYKRKAKKGPWNILNTQLKFAQIGGIFFQNKLKITWTTILKILTRLQLGNLTFSV